MDSIRCSSGKFKSEQARTRLHFCNTHHNEPLPIERFLGIAYRKHGRGLRKSTRTIGVTVFHTLRKGPRIVNIAQLARDTGYSDKTVSRAIKFFSRFGKIQRINERRTGKRRPCEYKLQDSFTESQEAAKPQEKGRCEVSRYSHSIRSLKKKKNQPRQDHPGCFSLKSFKNIQKTFQLMPRDKKKLSAIARKTCEAGAVSAVLDCLWQRDCCSGVWLSAIGTLQNLTIDESEKELTWRARKGIAGLIGGLNEERFKAIMLDQPANEQEAAERDIARIDRRLVGLRKWGNFHGKTMSSWSCEKRIQLTRKRYETRRRLPGAISTDGFFKTIDKPQPQPKPRPPRGRVFHASEHYTAKRTPLSGEALRRRKEAARKALGGHEKPESEGAAFPTYNYKLG